jgi:hypothetical protein
LLVFILTTITDNSITVVSRVVVQSDWVTRRKRFVVFFIEGCEFEGGQRLI